MLVYRFGLLPPTENHELVLAQMRAAHVYRNRLTEIERARRAKVRSINSAHGDIAAAERAAAAAAEAEQEAARAVSAHRASTRTRAVPAPLKETLTGARVAKRDAVQKLRAMRAAAREDVSTVSAVEKVNEEASAEQKAARAACGVYWGTYLLVEEAMDAARKTPLYDGAEPNDPRFARWEGEGTVGVQLQGGLPTPEAFGDDTRIQIRQIPLPPGVSARHKPRAEVRLRVGSDGRAPIWATWIAILHRPLPEGGTIKRAAVHLRKIGPRSRWFLDVVVDAPAGPRRCGEGAVAVDLGWRKIGEEIRVAVWRAEDGETGEIRIPEKLVGSLRKPDDLREIRDRAFNAARDVLATWIAQQQVIPDWLREASAHLRQWRSPGRLASLVLRWRKERFEGDAAGYDVLERWRYHDHHLWEWETSQRSKSLGHRREVYRVAAARLAERFGVVVLEKFDLRQIARRPVKESEEAENEVSRSNRHLVAVSELRSALRQAFLSRGGEVAEVDAGDTTRICPVCGLVERFDAAAMVHHACGGCGTVRDQDEGAAQNILDRWRERRSDAETAGVARSNETPEKGAGKWTKVKEKTIAKTARKEALAAQAATG